MSKSISLNITPASEATNKFSIKFVSPLKKQAGITSKTVAFIVSVNDEVEGHCEVPLDEFNTFCIELAKAHKNIMKS